MANIRIIRKDITTLEVDAVVNAANSSLLGGGGVDGAIHNAAGPKLLEECKTLNGCETGKAKITEGYNLPAKYIIHAVGPIYHGGNDQEADLLYSAYWNSLDIAEQHGVKSIAFPNISTGIYGYPKKEAAEIVRKVIKDFIDERPGSIENIIFVCFDRENYDIYEELFSLNNEY
ncbi:MAG: O-acetyl-ADP-ribose deacetylase [Candidatus Muiribacterium halophilum]|uniref:O-acetyl-ADP-ribose deacetylase n=1 Tax=Muiribacterium halophilum TaxID=2053465 RepID=A0A2N5ZLB0_MUIH1|nr:MAG: O-acetyl-ADP-ribose deacetylase [Candidatus Muirbacterium halophilum]